RGLRGVWHCFRRRQHNLESGSAPGTCALRRDRAAVRLDDRLCDTQAQAETSKRLVEAFERIEYPRQQSRRDTGPVVADLEKHLILGAATANRDDALFAGEADRVMQQVPYH